MVRAHFLAVAAIVALAVGVLAGYLIWHNSGVVTILNTEKVERAIEQSILQQRSLRANVSCPSGVHQKKGLQFICTASLKKGLAPFKVTEVDNNGNVTYLGIK